MPTAQSITTAEWSSHRHVIQDLYVEKDRPLAEIIQQLTSQGFFASRGQYLRQFKKWGISKNTSAKEWKRINRKIQTRKQQGKESQVVINGALIPPRKVRKETSRYDFPSYLAAQSPSPGPMDGIMVCTPPTTNMFEQEAVQAQPICHLGVIDEVVMHTPLNPLALEQVSIPTQLLGIRSRSASPVIPPTRRMDIIIPKDLPYYVFTEELYSSALNFFNAIESASSGVELAVKSIANGMQATLESLSASIIDRQVAGAGAMNLNNSEEEMLSLYLPPVDGESAWQVSNIHEDSELSLGLRLVKAVILICANNLQSEKRDPLFGDMLGIPMESDAVERFLQFIVTNNLYSVVEKIVRLKTASTDVFAGQALICAVDMEDYRLIRSLLKERPPLNVVHPTRYLHFNDCLIFPTALQVAVYVRNLQIIRTLLAAASDQSLTTGPFFSRKALFNGALKVFVSTPRSSTDRDIEILQTLLDVQEALGCIEYIQESWRNAANLAIEVRATEAFHVLLKRLCCLEQSDSSLQDPLLQLEMALWNRDLILAQTLLWRYPDIECQFDPQKLHAKLIFTPSLRGIRRSGKLTSLNELRLVLLWLAVTSGDLQLVKLALEKEIHLLKVHEYAQDIFYAALSQNHVGILDILLKTGVDINDPKLSLLSNAVRSGYEMIVFLLRQGADPHLLSLYYERLFRTQDFCWPAVVASRYKEWEIRDLLISIGHEIPLAEIAVLLPVSIEHGGLSAFRDVVRVCARINSVSSLAVVSTMGTTAYAGVAILLNREGLRCIEWLVNSNIGLGLLSGYFEGDHQSLTEAYFEFYMENICSDDLLEFHHIVPFMAPPEVLGALLDLGIAPGNGLMSLCARSHSTTNMRLLLDRRATLGLPFTKNDMTLILQQVNDRRKKKYGESIISRDQYFSMVQWLMDQGALINDPWFDYILRHKTLEVRELAWKTISYGNKWLAAIEFGLPAVEKLLELGTGVNEVLVYYRPWANTPLIAAVEEGKHAIVSYLLQNGADVNLRSGKGRTALSRSASNGYFQITLELLRAGADINAPSTDGTALQQAALNGRLDIVHLLVENNHETEKLYTDCCEAARIAHNSVIASILIKHAKRLEENFGFRG